MRTEATIQHAEYACRTERAYENTGGAYTSEIRACFPLRSVAGWAHFLTCDASCVQGRHTTLERCYGSPTAAVSIAHSLHISMCSRERRWLSVLGYTSHLIFHPLLQRW
jgi:hypothetical protein